MNENKTGPAVLKYLNRVDTKYKYEYKKNEILQVKNSLFKLPKDYEKFKAK